MARNVKARVVVVTGQDMIECHSCGGLYGAHIAEMIFDGHDRCAACRGVPPTFPMVKVPSEDIEIC